MPVLKTTTDIRPGLLAKLVSDGQLRGVHALSAGQFGRTNQLANLGLAS